MKFSVTSYNAVAVWKWDTHPSSSDHKLYHYAKNDTADKGAYDDDDDEEDDEDDDVCGICRLAFESTCPDCKIPGDDCPLIWGECTHVFHMHCLLKWIDTESSKGQCPMDRRPWATADRAPDQLPTTTSGEPVATVTPGPPSGFEDDQAEATAQWGPDTQRRRASVRFAPPVTRDEGEGTEWDGSDGGEEDPDGMDVDDPHPSSLRL